MDYELREHALPGASEPEPVRLTSPRRIAKSVILRDGRRYVIVAVPATDRLDMRRLRRLLGASRRLRPASEQEIARDFPTLTPGAAPPFGPATPAVEVLDSSLLEHDRILCGSGCRSHSVLLDPREVVRVTGARAAAICER